MERTAADDETNNETIEGDDPSDGETITLLDEEGRSHRFTLWDVVEVDERRYALLIPEGEADDEAYVFRVEQRDGEDLLVPVEDEAELEKVIESLENEADEDPDQN